MGILLSLSTPGAIYVQVNRPLIAISVLAISLLWLSFFVLSRAIVTPQGFYLLNAGLLAIHLISWAYGSFLAFNNNKHRFCSVVPRTTLKMCGWLAFCWVIALFIHFNKSWLLGFNMYHIPSRSMQPTLNVGDIVLSDTWFRADDIQENSVVIFKRHERGIILIKRITQIRQTPEGHSEIFIEGDNKNYSVDSRRFGWVGGDNIIGLATSKIFSLNKANFKRHEYPSNL